MIRSLSCQGAFIELDKGMVLVGDLLNVRFVIPDAEKGIEANNTAVVWQGQYGSDGAWGTGVQFLDLYPEEAEQIGRYVEHCLHSHDRENHSFHERRMEQKNAPV